MDACRRPKFTLDRRRSLWCYNPPAMKLSKGGFCCFLGVVASAFHSTSAMGATIRDDQPDSAYLDLGGRLDYAPVGSFVNSFGLNGSGTLIAPDWVLTAGHNLIAASSGTFTINGASYSSTELIRNPGWQESNPLGGYDFGLVHLSTPVAGVTPASLYTGSSEFGQMATFVGFGFTGTGLTGYRTLDNRKRAFQNIIDGDFGNPSVLLGCDFDNPHTTADNAFGSAIPLDLEGSVAPGDSGGGVFLTIGSQIYLAGVISFVAGTDGSGNADYGDVSGFGRVSAFTPWIISTVPEPSAATLLAGSGIAALFWRLLRRVNGGRKAIGS